MRYKLKTKIKNKKAGEENKMKNNLLRKNLKKSEKGITLIALVVTIIVLLILAGVVINMLRGDNGIISRAGEARYANTISSFDEQTKLSSMAVKTAIESNKVSKPGYIATTEENTQTLATEVAKELGLTGAILGNASNTQKISTEGYTVAYYLDTKGDSTTNGNTYIVIWYTDNSLRSTLKREEAKLNFGLKDLATNKSINQAVIACAIHIENYGSEMSEKALTSTTDANADTDGDIAKGKFDDTTLKGLFNVEQSDDGSSNSQTPTVHTPVDASAYGKKVTNYTVGGEWEVFYDGAVEEGGESRIYLIKKDATSEQALSTSDYGGTADFVDSSKLSKYPALQLGILYKTFLNGSNLYSSDKKHMKATQYLLDSSLSKWTAYKNETYADFVIGGPTPELFVASWNAAHPSSQQAVPTASVNGYETSWTGKIPSGTVWNRGSSYWLAYPAVYYTNRSFREKYVIYVSSIHEEMFVGEWDYSGNAGFRPIVCLKSGLHLEKQNTGGLETYKIADNRTELIK